MTEEQALLLVYAQQLQKVQERHNTLQAHFIPKAEIRANDVLIVTVNHNDGPKVFEFGRDKVVLDVVMSIANDGTISIKDNGTSHYPIPGPFRIFKYKGGVWNNEYLELRSSNQLAEIRIISRTAEHGLAELRISVQQHIRTGTKYPICYKPGVDAALKQAYALWKKK